MFVWVILSSCTPFFPLLTGQRDNTPPWIETFQQTGPGEFTIWFNEPVQLPQGGQEWLVSTQRPPTAASTEDRRLILLWDTDPASGLGQPFSIQGRVHDLSDNALYFDLPGFGFNTQPAVLQLNEIRSVHSKTRPEAIELMCLQGGSLGGQTLWIGTPNRFTSRLVFPDLEMSQGDYAVVFLRTEEHILEPCRLERFQDTYWGFLQASDGMSGTIDGLRLSLVNPDIPVFLLPGGLSDTSQAITLTVSPMYTSPESVVDAMMYTKRAAEPAESYGGFGSAASLETAEELVAMNVWSIAGDTNLTPSHFISNTGSTSTRTLNRGFAPQEWFIAPTGGATLGGENTTDRYNSNR